MFSYVDPQLSWTDLAWIRKTTGGLPIIVKGIQTAEDAALCAHYGVEGIYLSNHGGRQLEGAPSALETLLEIRRYEPQVFKKCEVYVDGGIRRGTDVLKALALGATAVGVGRPCEFLSVLSEGAWELTQSSRSHVLSRLWRGGSRDRREDSARRARAEPEAVGRDQAVRTESCDGESCAAASSILQRADPAILQINTRQLDNIMYDGYKSPRTGIWAKL